MDLTGGMSQSPKKAPESFEMEKQAFALDEKLARCQVQEEEQFKMAQKQTRDLLESAATEHIARGYADEQTTEMIKDVEDGLMENLAKMRQDRHGRETEFQRLIEKEVESTRQDLGEEKSRREISQQGYAREVGEEICVLYKELENSRSARLEQGERLVAAMDAKFDEIREAVAAERKIRAEAENTMLSMLQEMCVKMQEEVQYERQERENSEEKVLQLLERVLEGMCNRVEGTVHSVQASTSKVNNTRASFLYSGGGGGGAGSEPGSPLSP